MSTDPATLVTSLCNSLLDGNMVKTCAFLTPDVHYHNMPWAPVTGHAAVRRVLDPLVQGPDCALKAMLIEHTLRQGDVVMNARVETWERAGVRVDLPVAGLFVVRDGLIARWVDYWDLTTIAPLLATLEA